MAAAGGAMAQMTAPMKNFNVTSPVSNGPYVAGQILPCTYVLFSEVDSSSLQLQIVLEPVSGGASNSTTTAPTTMVIAQSADVSKTDGSAKQNGNMTYYEHSINYSIPKAATPGNYDVVFKDLSTNTDLSVPIEIRPMSAATSSHPSATGSSGGDMSVFASAPSMHHQQLTAKALWALAIVAGVAIML
ncbi:hypothetical protein BDB00DRAFT_774843 [Zychaea mexicana]|uniref:uncharacterized protein n=1 Tax=Zychaea mexicana TaxID=64656 RepID=UPI0022FDE527|nr:uncharacterized protein BDB00DRAFT_774843 [Zychaea mexicana]KAI9484490.1 hypothetical protein BDB00DRAFT_774843 [Zychaea mexicana]